MARRWHVRNEGPKPKTKEKEKVEPKVESPQEEMSQEEPDARNDFGGGTNDDGEGEEQFEDFEIVLPSIRELEQSVLEYIIGQDDQVRQIITAIYKARTFVSIKSTIMIVGKSGTGKTATVKQILEQLGFPYTIEDATKYTREGYYGADVEEMVYNLIKNCNDDLDMAEQGIIVIDEIDKKADNGTDNDVSGVEVLKSLLKIIEGATMIVPKEDSESGGFVTAEFNTENLIIIFMGAFPGLDKIREKRLNAKPLGFTGTTQPIVEGTRKSRFLKKDFIEYGMTEEFMGRVRTIVEMNTLTKEDLVRILQRSKLSPFQQYKDELEIMGVKLEYYEGLLEDIAQDSLEVDTGARELASTTDYIFERIIYELLSDTEGYTVCKLLPGIVKDNTRFELS